MHQWEKTPPEEGWRWLPLFLAALLLHLAALPHMLNRFSGNTAVSNSKPAPIVQLTTAQRAQLKADRERLEKQKPPQVAKKDADKEKEKEKKENTQLNGQVVDVPPSPSDEAPDNARYLSEYNTKTERETRSRNASRDYQNAMNERTVTQKQEISTPLSNPDNSAIEIGPEQKANKQTNPKSGRDATFELPRLRARDKLALRLDPTMGRLRNHDATEEINGTGDRLRLSLATPGDSVDPEHPATAPKNGTPALQLIPDIGVLAKIAGAPANDHLADLEEGDGTFLNSREFKYASFFNRMKRGVSTHWRAIDEYRRRDPTGNIYGFRPRTTVLQVTLNADGTLKQVDVQSSSGVDFLDREAQAAFQRAQPFPNPPKGLMADNGEISFPFGFYIDFSPNGG